MRVNIPVFIFAALLLGSCSKKDPIVSLVKHNGQYGFIDNHGRWFINPNHDSLGILFNGYASSYKNDLVGIIDHNGELVVDHCYKFIGHVFDKRALVLLQNDRYNFVDIEGKLISTEQFEDAKDFGNGLAPVQREEDGLWEFINTEGETVIPQKFEAAYQFNNGFAKVFMNDWEEYLIDIDGNVVDTVINQKREKKYKLVGRPYSNSMGIENSRGELIMEKKYNYFGYRQGDVFWYSQNDLYGLADTSGNIIIGPEYQYLSYFADCGLALAQQGDKWGFIDKTGKVMIDFRYEKAKGFKHSLAAVKTSGKWGFIDPKGEMKIDPIFDRVGFQFRPVFGEYELMYKTDRE